MSASFQQSRPPHKIESRDLNQKNHPARAHQAMLLEVQYFGVGPSAGASSGNALQRPLASDKVNNLRSAQVSNHSTMRRQWLHAHARDEFVLFVCSLSVPPSPLLKWVRTKCVPAVYWEKVGIWREMVEADGKSEKSERACALCVLEAWIILQVSAGTAGRAKLVGSPGQCVGLLCCMRIE